MRRFVFFILVQIIIVSLSNSLLARDTFTSKVSEVPGNPAYCLAVHNIGELELTVQNNGTFGVYGSFGQRFVDCFTGEAVGFGCEFPKNTQLENLYYSTLWIGAVLADDTVVTTGLDGWNNDGREFHPDEEPAGNMIFRSIIDPDAPGYDDAVSEQDIIAVYSDTLRGTSRDYFYARPHRPLYVQVKQKSYAWSYPYAEDIVLVDLEITNIGVSNLYNVYLGLFVDANVGYNAGYWLDDVSGFIKDVPVELNCGIFKDTIDIAWTADNDGDPYKGEFKVNYGVDEPSMLIPRKSAPHFVGTRVLRTPSEDAKFSFNWWVSNYDPKYDYGPMNKKTPRDFRTGGLGTPEGDKNKYYMLSNGDVDFDQPMLGNIKDYDQNWIAPDRYSSISIGRGANSQYLMSYGPFTIGTTETVPFTFAFIGGENLHHVVENAAYLYYQPDKYYENLDFSDLTENAKWAGWIYDNPGVDTDGDGYYGKYRVCAKDSTTILGQWIITDADTIYYTGDGVPDFRGAAPPPAPKVKIFPVVNGLKVRFNGQFSERTRDFLTGEIDFEGYNIYIARDERSSSYALVTTHDRENFDKFVWSRYSRGGSYLLLDAPFTKEELTCLYGDSCNDPYFNLYSHGIGNPYIHPEYPDSIFYFAPHGSNADNWGNNTPIKKVYPNEPFVPFNVDLDTLDERFFTEEGLLKYYEYEYTLENLLPTVPYWVSVTAYDVGSPKSDLDVLETSITQNTQVYYPLASEDQVEGENLKVYIYPNPYRIDGDYRLDGYEGRNDFRPNYRVRKLNFANLPAKCTIRVFSLDGDLIRELIHDMDPSDPNSSHHEWDLISRNTQEIVSGLYYWTVEDEHGQVQIGKLVIIM